MSQCCQVVLHAYLHTDHLLPPLPLTFSCHLENPKSTFEDQHDARVPPSAVARALLQLNDRGSNMRRRRRLRRNHPQTQTQKSLSLILSLRLKKDSVSTLKKVSV